MTGSSSPNFAVNLGQVSHRGALHERDGIPNQDSVILLDDNPGVFAVALGEGAASGTVTSAFTKIVEQHAGRLGVTELMTLGMGHAHAELGRAKTAGDVPEHAASTLVALVVNLEDGSYTGGRVGNSYLTRVERGGKFLTLGGARNSHYVVGSGDLHLSISPTQELKDENTRFMVASTGINSTANRLRLSGLDPGKDIMDAAKSAWSLATAYVRGPLSAAEAVAAEAVVKKPEGPKWPWDTTIVIADVTRLPKGNAEDR